jgi:hypothetical protein
MPISYVQGILGVPMQEDSTRSDRGDMAVLIYHVQNDVK